MSSVEQITDVIGPDDYVRYELDEAEASTALAVEDAVSVDRVLKKYGNSRVFFGSPTGIEHLLTWHLDDAAHMDTIPFEMVQVPADLLPMVKRHAVLGRGVTWRWMWTDTVPAPVVGEDKIRELSESDHAKAIQRLLKQASPHAAVVPGDGRTKRWLGILDDAGAVTGVVALRRTHGGYQHITSIAVSESLRGTGLGKALLGYAVRTALAERPVCTLGGYDSNEAAQRLAAYFDFHVTHHWATYHLVAGKD